MAVTSNTKILIKNTSILGICMFSSKVLVFFLVPLYTAILSTAEYGIYDIAVTTMQLLYPVLTVNIAEAVMRFLMDKDASRNTIIGFSMRIVFGASLVMGALLLCNSIFHLWTDIEGLEGYIFFYYISYVLNNWLIQAAKGLEKIKCMGIAGLIGTAATILLNVLILFVLKSRLEGFFIANALGQLIPGVFIACQIRVWKYLQFKRSKNLQVQMLKYSAPMILVAISWWANNSADKYVVTWLCGTAANGLLSIAYKIPSILSTVQQIFIQAWQVSAVKEYDSKEATSFYRNTFIYLNALLCMACGILIVANRFLASFLFANEFYYAWKYVPFLLLSSVFNAASGYIGAILLAQKNSRSITLSAVIGIGTNIVLCIALVWAIGIQGAAIAAVVSSAIIYVARKMSLKVKIFGEEYKYVLISWLVLAASAFFEIYTGYYALTVLCLALIVFIYRKQIGTLLKEIMPMLRHQTDKGVIDELHK